MFFKKKKGTGIGFGEHQKNNIGTRNSHGHTRQLITSKSFLTNDPATFVNTDNLIQ